MSSVTTTVVSTSLTDVSSMNTRLLPASVVITNTIGLLLFITAQSAICCLLQNCTSSRSISCCNATCKLVYCSLCYRRTCSSRLLLYSLSFSLSFFLSSFSFFSFSFFFSFSSSSLHLLFFFLFKSRFNNLDLKPLTDLALVSFSSSSCLLKCNTLYYSTLDT
jgi:hypothetical protein